jgi:anti-sigma regulatory factor (Ser/Thr protein kinase)
MVALLWDEGNVPGAIALESLWNDLAEHHRFTLLCAYPTASLGAAALTDVHRVCDLHSAVLPPSSYGASTAPGSSTGAHRREVFLPVPEAVAAARRLVADAVTSWGALDVAWEAELIASEMATNAVRHGESPFRASVSHRDDVIRIAVEDAGPGWPRRREATTHDFGGRGVLIVAELAHRWGADEQPQGKVIWAELHTGLTGSRDAARYVR